VSSGLRITVVGAGYVGLSNAVLLAQRHSVVALDISAPRVAAINARRSPIEDAELQQMLSQGTLDLRATTDARDAYANADLVVVATPTDYDPDSN
jgi:UDPglucose 6-dehydrogenase